MDSVSTVHHLACSVCLRPFFTVFPLFWAIGVYFMFAPMRVSPDWEQGKTEAEKEKILSDLRQTEMKWAKRCLWALLSFFVCMILIIVAVVVSRRH
ncbi:hypothetical protein EDC04DRAFT_1628672 [Pisolithus marmoratus]|nr:hypothetical protein EDC04DRAFT_1628672 [Pisolithus marmoratus]